MAYISQRQLESLKNLVMPGKVIVIYGVRQVGKTTVERYLGLLEKVFVIYRLSGFNRNLRKEITKSHKYYFTDNGVRNAVIQNFNPINLRDDLGEIWENYVLAERMKRREYLRESCNAYFWRTYDKKEIDLVEEHMGKLHGYEVKWGKISKKAPRDWRGNYPMAGFEIINRDNYLEFIQ